MAVVTLPFSLEGKRRMGQAMDGLSQLRDCVDSVIAIPNDRLLNSVARNTPVAEAFRVADDVLRQAVQGISDIITVPGQINLDFADVRAVMRGMGQAVMGTGVGQGENRAVEAAQRAISNPLLEDSSIEGAKGIIVNITGGTDLSLSEAAEATALITKVADPDANVIYGIVTDESMGNAVKVTVIATGFNRPRAQGRADTGRPRELHDDAVVVRSVRLGRGGGRRLLPQDAERQGGVGGGGSAASGGGGRFDLDVPALPAAQGRRRRERVVASFSREGACDKCGREYVITGASINPGTETEAPRRFRCECGGWLEAFIPGSVNLERVQVEPKEE